MVAALGVDQKMAVHRRLLPRRGAGRVRRRAAAAARGRQPAHGPRDHRRGLRRRRGRRHGRVAGAFLAALLIAELQACMLIVPPFTCSASQIALAKMTLIPSFLVMAVVLVVRPYGLLGKPPAQRARRRVRCEPVVRPAPRALKVARARGCWPSCCSCAARRRRLRADRADRDRDLRAVRRPACISSWGRAGMASFGHAAYFGLGAYGAALALKHLGGADGASGCSRRRSRPGSRGVAVRLVLRAALGRLSRDADARLRADRLVDRLPMGRADRRRQRHSRRLADRLGARARPPTTT